jgi:NAD(P)H-hydrate epimerase
MKISWELNRQDWIDSVVVTAAEMRAIEGRVFAAGMPVAALMEKVAGAIARRTIELYPLTAYRRWGILVGNGHNGGDALVVARELFWRGYEVVLFYPDRQGMKELTGQHASYLDSLGVSVVEDINELQGCDIVLDGLFGFGLNRTLTGVWRETIESIASWPMPIVSIDLPSGLHGDTGEAMGTAVRADRTFCLGLWKLAFFQDRALEYLGECELIDFDLRVEDICHVLGVEWGDLRFRRWSDLSAQLFLPGKRSILTHKYREGNLLLVCGSQEYAGAAILAGLGARSTGIGMLSIAVPASIKPLVVNALPEAIVIGCKETKSGAIKALPEIDLSRYHAIACGCGLTGKPKRTIATLLGIDLPLILDADALNIAASEGYLTTISQMRRSPTILTPHTGEFRRLFPTLDVGNRSTAVRSAARISQSIVLLKGARTLIANPLGETIAIPHSTPALARGGSGDILTGIIGGLVAIAKAKNRPDRDLPSIVATAAWWHAKAAMAAEDDRTAVGVDPLALVSYLQAIWRN